MTFNTYKLKLLGALCLMLVSMTFLTGFAPFNSGGLLRFQVADGSGDLSDEGDLNWTEVEADPIFHSLSSRYGGGGVLLYAEFPESEAGFSGLFLMDLRHAGLPDLRETDLSLPSKRLELLYQEWRGSRELFDGQRVEGEVTIKDMFRGETVSALAVSFDLTFFSSGPDGRPNTGDDVWRRVKGSATTSPTVDIAVNREADLAARRYEDEYDPEGDIYVSCFGDTYIEETTYQEEEDVYLYEDDDGGGCEGDTWKDDSEDPQESGGCTGEKVVDDGEPDPNGGCEGTGDDFGDDYDDSSEDSSSDSDDSFYSEDDYDDGGGCDDSDDEYDDGGADSGCDSGDSGDSEDSDDDSDDGDSDAGCEGDSVDDEEASRGGGEIRYAGFLACGPANGVSNRGGAVPMSRAKLRRYLDRLEISKRGRAHKAHRFGKRTSRKIRKFARYAPFFFLMLLIHFWRRREDYA